MPLRFGPPLPRPVWNDLNVVDRQRAALFWHFMGGVEGEFPTIDALLGSSELDRRVLRNEAHEAVAVWWQWKDGGLLFAPESSQLLGEAMQHGFVGREPELWRQIAATRDPPGLISWSFEERAKPLWINPPDPAALVASIEVSGRTPLEHSVRVPKEPSEKKSSPSVTPSSASTYEKGDRVRILWNDSWWAGEILEVEGPGQYRVRYVGYDDSWNDTVGPDHLRPAPKRKTAKKKGPMKKTAKKKTAKKAPKKRAKKTTAKAGKRRVKKSAKRTTKRSPKKGAKRTAKRTKRAGKKSAKRSVKRATKKTSKKAPKRKKTASAKKRGGKAKRTSKK